jgi:tetraacyldisaccharide 4'-kinase
MAPLGALWGAATAIRAGLYALGLRRPARLGGTVISVGNLSVGGSGKTPIVEWIGRLLRDAGVPVAVLSRGYRGSFRGDPLLVSDGVTVMADAATAGDEPVMLARSLPGVVVAVGRERTSAGRLVEERFGPRVHVLDDGYQHLRLARDLDILCLDPADLDDRPLPAGRLREGLSAVGRADLVLLTNADGYGPDRLERLRGELGPERAFVVRRRALGFFAADGTERPAPSRPFLLSGIARPERFEADVRAQVAEPAGHARFRDHHGFTAAELSEVCARARARRADALVTTAKDAVRLPPVTLDLPLLVFRTSPEIAGGDRLGARLLEAVRRGAGAKRPNRARHVLEDAGARAVESLCRIVPRPAILALGRGLGRILADLDHRHVGIAADNLRRSFPHWDGSRILRTARDVYTHFGEVLLDVVWLTGRSREDVLSLVADVEGRHHVEAALAAGRGAVMVTAHYGNWELNGVAHGLLFGRMGVVARPLDNPLLDRRLCAARTQGGNVVIYKQRAVNQVLRLLREGRAVAILIDQNVQAKDGIFVDFFGRPAATTTVAAALAVKTGCALVPAHARRLGDGRYRIIYDPPVTWTPSGDRQADIASVTQRLTWIIEGWVRETPDQWLWIHRRWKTQPGGA